jgi:poly(A) polymerase Pap1
MLQEHNYNNIKTQLSSYSSTAKPVLMMVLQICMLWPFKVMFLCKYFRWYFRSWIYEFPTGTILSDIYNMNTNIQINLPCKVHCFLPDTF